MLGFGSYLLTVIEFAGIGAAVIVGSWILTAVYVVWANRYYDPEAQRLRETLLTRR